MKTKQIVYLAFGGNSEDDFKLRGQFSSMTRAENAIQDGLFTMYEIQEAFKIEGLEVDANIYQHSYKALTEQDAKEHAHFLSAMQV